MFSIVLPTWNNLVLLQLCVRSIRANSSHAHQLIVHVNQGHDGTRDWLREQNITFTASDDNVGICLAVNEAAGRASERYLVYLNDDMYCLPGWDEALLRRAQVMPSSLYMVSGTMIERRETGNACVVLGDYGSGPEDFAEDRLLADAARLQRADWYGATWPPTLVERDWWVRLGGYSSELSPGFGSDNDFSMKLWHAGCRHFVGVGSSLVYHFGSKSTGRVRRNDSRRQFLNKWGITQSTFDRYYLRRGTAIGSQGDRLPEPEAGAGLSWNRLRSDLKRRLT